MIETKVLRFISFLLFIGGFLALINANTFTIAMINSLNKEDYYFYGGHGFYEWNILGFIYTLFSACIAAFQVFIGYLGLQFYKKFNTYLQEDTEEDYEYEDEKTLEKNDEKDENNDEDDMEFANSILNSIKNCISKGAFFLISVLVINILTSFSIYGYGINLPFVLMSFVIPAVYIYVSIQIKNEIVKQIFD